MGRGEEDAEAVGRCDICDTSLLVNEGWGGSQHGARHRCASIGWGRLLRIGGSSDGILIRDPVEDHGGGVGGSGWPATRGFVVVIIGNG